MNIVRNYFLFRDLKLSYLESGSAERGTIIITHANGYSSGCYSYIMRAFTNYKIFALDFAGHGESESTLDFKNWLFFRDQVIAFVNHLQIHEAIGIGHSIGGASLLMASKLLPSKFQKLILFDPTILDIPRLLLSKVIGNPLAKMALKRRRKFTSKEQVRKTYRKFSAFSKWDEEIFEDYLATCFRDTEHGVELACLPELEAKIFNSLSVFSPLRYLFIPTESHVIIPQNYEVCSPSCARRIARGNKNSTVTIMPGFTHFFPFEEKEWVLKKLNSIL